LRHGCAPQFRRDLSLELSVSAPTLPEIEAILSPSPGNTRAHDTAEGNRQMKTRRWMETILKEAEKSEGEIKLVWTRENRPRRAAAKPTGIEAAE
jgi:hypothetical protein